MTRSLFRIFKWVSLFSLVCIFACAGVGNVSEDSDTGTTSEDGGVGTTVNKPGLPTLSLFPDFAEAFPDETLGSTSESLSLTSASFAAIGGGSTLRYLAASQLWTGVVTEGSVREGRILRSELAVFGQLTARSISEAGLGEADENLQSVVLQTETGVAHLVDTDTAWTVQFKQESTDAAYVRFYFVNGTTGLIEGTYVVKTDESGNPESGIFAYVKPSLLSATPASGRALVAFSFDLSDTARNLFALRETYYNDSRATNITYDLHQQCDASSQDCLGEYLELWNDASRSINEANNIRVSWNDGTNAVCLAEISYNGSETTSETTHSFTGPDSPSEADVQDDVCSVTKPFWGDHVFAEGDLPQRFEDTDPPGGTALLYYVDGVSTTGWDTLTPALITGWLTGSEF